jgi:prevent-host-death family protein
MSRTVGAYEAKTHLPQLLDEVARGEKITITRRGVPVAVLMPAPGRSKRAVAEAIAELEELSKGLSLGGLSVREMIEEGRV